MTNHNLRALVWRGVIGLYAVGCAAVTTYLARI